MKNKEIWKEYPLDLGFPTDFKIEFSNLGRIKTYSQLAPEGNIIKGSLQSGFPIFRATFTDALKPNDAKKLEEIDGEILELNSNIKDFQSTTELSKKSEEYKTKLQDLRKNRDALVKKRSQMNSKFRKKVSKYVAILVHKAVAELFLEKPADKSKKFIIHLDFDKENNNIENLAWANQAELTNRQMKHPKVILNEFKKQFTEQKPNVKGSKLNEYDVLFIKNKLEKGGITIKKLAHQFGVSDMQIHRIKTGENWSHVKTVSELKAEYAEMKK